MDDESRCAYVSAGHVLFFEDGVTKQTRDDVLCSTLYSQTGASHKYSKFTESSEWSAKCNEVMSLFGWLTLQERTQDYLYSAEVSLGVERTLAELLRLRVPAALLQRLLRLCTDLKASSHHDPAQRLLLEHALDSQADMDSTTLILLVSFISPASLITTVFLISKMPALGEQSPISAHLSTPRSSGSLSITVSSAEFVERRYRRIRERVITELGAAKNECVIALSEGGMA